jgi:CubicO group peptidase (beta-lactamase class C family)
LGKLRQQQGREPNTGTTIVDRFGYPFIYEPGTSFFYSTSIDWAGKLVERVTGKSLEEYMQENLWKKLGVKSLTFWPYKDPALKDNVPGLTTRTPEGGLAPFTLPFINTNTTDCFGGHGMYGTMSDYLKVQQSILRNDGKLLKPETVEQMFQPQLTPDQKKGFKDFMQSPFGALAIGEWGPDMDLDWGLGGILVMRDDNGRRKKGTLGWGGMANTYWLIDREAGLALTFGTQVLPPGDKKVEEMISAVEYGLYEKRGVKF